MLEKYKYIYINYSKKCVIIKIEKKYLFVFNYKNLVSTCLLILLEITTH